MAIAARQAHKAIPAANASRRDRLHGSSLFFQRNHLRIGNQVRIPLGGVFRPEIA